MKIFISQPMNGKSEDEILKARNDLITRAKAQFGEDVEIADSYFGDFPVAKTKCPPLYFLSKSIMKLSECDAVMFADGWQNARGCIVERMISSLYGIKII